MVSIVFLETDHFIVVKNPLSPVEHPGGIGVNCELFELGVEQFVVSHLARNIPVQHCSN